MFVIHQKKIISILIIHSIILFNRRYKPFTVVGPHWPSLAFVGLQWLALACVGLHWPLLACIGLHWHLWAFVGLCWPAVACVGLCWPLLAFVGLCWPALAFVGLHWPVVACVGLRWPVLACIGLCWPLLACVDRHPLLGHRSFVVNNYISSVSIIKQLRNNKKHTMMGPNDDAHRLGHPIPLCWLSWAFIGLHVPLLACIFAFVGIRGPSSLWWQPLRSLALVVTWRHVEVVCVGSVDICSLFNNK